MYKKTIDVNYIMAMRYMEYIVFIAITPDENYKYIGESDFIAITGKLSKNNLINENYKDSIPYLADHYEQRIPERELMENWGIHLSIRKCDNQERLFLTTEINGDGVNVNVVGFSKIGANPKLITFKGVWEVYRKSKGFQLCNSRCLLSQPPSIRKRLECLKF